MTVEGRRAFAGGDVGTPAPAPAVSVVMSAYNSAEFLEACLDSVRRQSFTDFELIIVDDGSTDRTRDILLAYAARDDRIRLILKDSNEGLAVARNGCVDAARGRYVTFIDTDDLVHPDLLRCAVEAAERDHSDLVIWDYVKFCGAVDTIRPAAPSGLQFMDPGNKAALLELPAFACAKLIRTEILKKLGVRFPPSLTYQDIPVHWRLVTSLDRISLVPMRLFYYRQHGEATTSGKGWKRADLIVILDLVKKDLVDRGLFGEYQEIFTMKQLNGFHGVHDVVTPDLKPDVLRLIGERLGPQHWDYIHSGKPLRWQARSFYKGLNGDRIEALRLGVWQLVRRAYRAMRAAPASLSPR